MRGFVAMSCFKSALLRTNIAHAKNAPGITFVQSRALFFPWLSGHAVLIATIFSKEMVFVKNKMTVNPIKVWIYSWFPLNFKNFPGTTSK